MSILAKTRRIYAMTVADENSAYFFQDESDDTHVVLELGSWEDMGSPGQITVTVEPGDLLNG